MIGEAGASTDRPLSDVRVIEMGTLVAGAFCAQLLGDFGADVIKVEPPGAGDPMRNWGRAPANGQWLWWPIIARNKRSVTLDLRRPEAQEAVLRLAAVSDVVVENFRPGTLERWGLGYDRLSERNPGLVLTRVTGFGQTGPYAGDAGYGVIGEALAGLRHVTGDPDRPPSRVGISLGDSLAGTFATLGTLVALSERRRTGRGQVVDTAIYESVLALMESLVPDFELAGHTRERSGAILPGIAPSNVYATADGDVLIGANQDSVFARLVLAMGEEELARDERFRTHEARGRNQAVLDERIERWTRGLATDEVIARLREAGVPVGRIATARDIARDPHVVARGAITRVPHPTLGEFPMQNVFPRLSRTPGSIRWVGPRLGEHNRDVLAGVLELSDAEIARLTAVETEAEVDPQEAHA